jgi:hypothetical protein
MAHFQFNARDRVATRQPQADGVDAMAQGPGWFESSWDLVRGLEVREGLPSDARLHEWLDAWLRDERGAAPSALAQRDEQPGARLVPAAPHGALVHALQLGDLGLAVAAEVTHLDQFGEFGIDGLQLV